MAKYRIEFDRSNCIGAGACVAIHPQAYVMKADGKPDLTGSDTGNTQMQVVELELDPHELEQHVQAARSCPVLVIHVTNLDTGEKLI